MKKIRRQILLCAIATLCTYAAFSETPKSSDSHGTPHIALIDINKVIRNYKPYLDYEKTVQVSLENVKKQIKEQEAAFAELQKQQAALVKELKDLPEKSDKRVAAQEALNNKTAEVIAKRDEVVQFRDTMSTGYVTNLKQEAIQAANKVIQFVKKYAPEKGYKMVINIPSADEKTGQNSVGSDVIVGLDELRKEAKDITEDVIKALE